MVNMKIYASLLGILLLVPTSLICDGEEASEESAQIYRHSRNHPLQLLLAQQKQKKEVNEYKVPSETLFVTINQVVLELAPIIVPFLVFFLVDSARSMACDKAASYVPDSYKLVDQPYLQINSRDAVRIGLEGASHIGLWSFLNGSRDEHDNFKLYCDKFMIADGVNASVKYMLIEKVLKPNVQERLIHKYPDVGSDEVRKENKHSRDLHTKYIGFAAARTYEEVYKVLRKHYTRQ